MTSWILVNEATGKLEMDRWYSNSEPTGDAEEGFLWSCREYYYHLSEGVPAMIRFCFGTAEGKSKWERTGQGDHIEILVIGTKIADIKAVAARLEQEIGVKKLNSQLILPDNLSGPLGRLKYVAQWFIGKK